MAVYLVHINEVAYCCAICMHTSHTLAKNLRTTNSNGFKTNELNNQLHYYNNYYSE